jgi:transposase
MSKGKRYTKEFKIEAVKQVAVHGYAVNDVAERLGISTKTLYAWLKRFSKPTEAREEEQDLRTCQRQSNFDPLSKKGTY